MPRVKSHYRDAREALKLRLVDIAEMVGLSVPYIAQIEHGDAPVPLKRRADFARAYGVTEQIIEMWHEERESDRVEEADRLRANMEGMSVEAIMRSRSRETGGRRALPTLHEALVNQFGWPHPYICTFKQLAYLREVKRQDISSSLEDVLMYYKILEESVHEFTLWNGAKLAAGCHGLTMNKRVRPDEHRHPSELLAKLAKEKEQDSSE